MDDTLIKTKGKKYHERAGIMTLLT